MINNSKDKTLSEYKMQKVLIIGCPGSGKSTFARSLAEIVGLPLYHLDMIFWNSDKTTVEREIFDKRLEELLHQPLWIIDGNYKRTMETRLAFCDTVFFLDYPTSVCLDGIISRKGKPRPDMPWVEDDKTDEDFLAFVKSFNTDIRPEIISLLKKYSQKSIIVLKTRKESEEYLSQLRKEPLCKKKP